jgi:hypothetical protein
VTLSDRLARFNRRLFNPVVRTFAGRRGSPVAVVVHRGRRSGRRYRTPVLAFRANDGYVVALFMAPTATGSATCWPPAPARWSEAAARSS